MNRIFKLVIVLFISAFSLTACNPIKSYSKSYSKNIVFKNIRGKSAPLFGLKSTVAVYTVDSTCHKHFQGGVKVRRFPVRIGLPANHYSFLVIQFKNLEKPELATDYGGYLMPRKGSKYHVYMIYHKNNFDLLVKEIRATGYNKPVELLPQVRCKFREDHFNPHKKQPATPLKDSDFGNIATLLAKRIKLPDGWLLRHTLKQPASVKSTDIP